jgi:hypothetical protein
MKPKMTQRQKLLNHFFDVGSITQREAIMDYSIQSLTRRITELRDDGYNIISEQKLHPITEQRYVRYHLGFPPRVVDLPSLDDLLVVFTV